MVHTPAVIALGREGEAEGTFKAILGSIASLRSAWTVSVEQRILSLQLAGLILTLYNRMFLNLWPILCSVTLQDPQSTHILVTLKVFVLFLASLGTGRLVFTDEDPGVQGLCKPLLQCPRRDVSCPGVGGVSFGGTTRQ